MDYVVKFIGHIDETRRPEGFPRDIVAIGTYRVENNQQLAENIHNETNAFIHNLKGMIVQLDPAQTNEINTVNFKGRVYVPMHMIAYLRTEISLMTPMPSLVETGQVIDGKNVKEFQIDGKKVLPS